MSRGSGRESVAAVVVTFHPDPEFSDRLSSLSDQVDHVVVVDNGSPDPPELPGGTQLIQAPANLGLAWALNQGLRRIVQQGRRWALTLDQDSRPEPDMVGRLLQAAHQAPDPESVALVAPLVVDPGWKGPYPFLRRGPLGTFRRAPCTGGVLDPVTTAITSGSLLNLPAYDSIGPFREDFFIDFVDTEYCLRAQTLGYRILAACEARLHHRLGSRRPATWAGVTLYPMFHPPDRWYYLSRNRIAMTRRYALRFPHWWAQESLANLYRLVRLALVEDRRTEKARAVLEGTLDGLRGRMGPRPAPGRVGR